jgi:sec-independent protein translocase protein TatA
MPIGLGPWELIIILLIVVVIFGAGRLSEVGGAMGKSIREFRKATTDEQHAAMTAATTTTTTTPAAVPPPAATVVTTPPTAVAVENKCPSCATINPSTQVFCGQCGTRLTRAA